MKTQRLEQLVERFATRRIAVIGDFFLDKYLDVDPSLDEPSLETGKTAHQVTGARVGPGAAGTVVNNLAALDAGTLYAVGAIGDDGEGFELRRELERIRCDTDRLLRFDWLMTPTYLKPRDQTDASLAGEHSRYDTLTRTPMPDEIVEEIVGALDSVLPEVDAVIIADQVVQDECGVVTPFLRDVLSERAEQFADLVFWADSRSNIRMFRNVITKPNQFEAAGRLNPHPDDTVTLCELKAAAGVLRGINGAPVCVTRGCDSVLVTDPEYTVIPSVEVPGPLDPTGAGDSFTAGAVLAMSSGATLAEAALVGCLTASITVQELATTGTATPAGLFERLELWRTQHPNGVVGETVR
ncbi:MAG: carbohydrate kinase [Planctomycetaceae bacterium]|jgi:sugar/nucleoside kinase (ribokinase family)|nr:carbohydrate kinase [Planctomycetaceae bacterium]MBT6156780.1 carbohydrate kinase [Planctomycetaceae bacterium]MBT6487735.1 carbohydrate kinase [Planctomycetaceae bacterium]